jgi:restriction endonuclease Mrr
VNRTGWAALYMMHAGLISRSKRGFIQIIDEGRRLLAVDPPPINNKVLEKYPQFIERVRKEKPVAGSGAIRNRRSSNTKRADGGSNP